VITSINTDNSNDYRALFQSAYDFLKANKSALSADRQASIDNMTGITSVQQYFSHLRDLLDLADQGGKKFLMLPLDEPVFEIDADKREITVPAVFKKNGISVQGDEIAESLIFRINRFFDYADLDNMTIQIQWENANKEQGLSNIYVKDNSKSADYLYFMWPLTEEITRYPGTIKFSVRCYNATGNTLAYSLSTKIAAATINAGHDYNVENWTTGIDDATAQFNNSIQNSKNTAAEDALAPYYLVNLDDETGEGENADYNNGQVLEAYIDETNPYQTLRVEATSNDAGTISYKWQYRDLLETTYTGGLTYDLAETVEYIPTTDEAKVDHKLYYKQSGDNYVPAEFEVTEGVQLYEKTSTYKVQYHAVGKNTVTLEDGVMPHVVGQYKAIARNTVGDNYEETDSVTIVFPSPEKLEFTETGDLSNNYFLNNNGIGSISTEVEIDERGAKATYDWLFANSPTGGFTPIDQLDEAEQAKLSAEGNTLTINNKPGYYRVIVKSTRNYDTIQKQSNVCKVTGALAAPTIVTPVTDTAVSSKYGTAQLVITIAPYANDLESEKVTY